jgi:exosome complex protein LRP1
MDDATLVKQYLHALHSATQSLAPDLTALLSTPLAEQLNQTSTATETINLANGSAYMLVSLAFAYLKSQGVNTAGHPIMEDLARVKAYMKRLTEWEARKETTVEKEDEETRRAKEFIRSALGQSSVVTGAVGPSISFKGTHTKFEPEVEKKDVKQISAAVETIRKGSTKGNDKKKKQQQKKKSNNRVSK